MADRLPARPAAYDAALADAVCAAVARGESLWQACARDDMPDRDSVLAWAVADEAFADRLDVAGVRACLAFEDDILAIADGFGLPEPEKPPTPSERMHRDRMRIAVRQWLMAKRDPERYGRVAALPLIDEPPPQPAPQPPAEDPKKTARREAAAWDLAEADGRMIAFNSCDELKAAANAALASGARPLTITSALLGGRAIPLAPLLGAGGVLDLEQLRVLRLARLQAVYRHAERSDAERQASPPSPVAAKAATAAVEALYASCEFPDYHRGFRAKFAEIFTDVANAWPEAWPDSAPPPI